MVVVEEAMAIATTTTCTTTIEVSRPTIDTAEIAGDLDLPTGIVVHTTMDNLHTLVAASITLEKEILTAWESFADTDITS